MTKRERVDRTFAFEKPDRVPFVPAIYEHKARLIGKRPSEVCRDGDLLHESLLRELETYDPDMLTVGVDVYNVEAEALGCEVRYFDESPDVPAVVSGIVRSREDLEKRQRPNPERDGRMPLFLDAAERLCREVGDDLYIRGALSGPFSIACSLFGTAELLVATVDDPDFVRDLLTFAAEVTRDFGEAFVRRGAGVIVFDSKASPQASSPKIFQDFVMPVYRDIVVPGLKTAGARHLPLIIGGDTTSIIGPLLETGATQLLCDAGSDLGVFLKGCRENRISLRANVDARLVHRGCPERIREEARRILRETAGQPGFLFGCGVVAYDCETSHVLALSEALSEFSSGQGSEP